MTNHWAEVERSFKTKSEAMRKFAETNK